MYAITQQQQQQHPPQMMPKKGSNGVMTGHDQTTVVLEQQNIENCKFESADHSKSHENGHHHHHHQHHHHQHGVIQSWNYDDEEPCGPQFWLELCGCTHLGNCQSPIDLQISQMRILPMDGVSLSLVNYGNPLAGHLLNNGHSIQFVPDSLVEPPEIYGGKLDQNYRFVQYHFHWAQDDNKGSEHTIGGLHYQGELHLVHQGVTDPSKLAVLAIFLKLGHEDKENSNGQEKKFVFNTDEMDALREVREFGQKVAVDIAHCLASKLPANYCSAANKQNNNSGEYCVSTFIRYQGSLTTPPCTENVTWTVFTDPLLITKEQLTLLRAVKDCSGKTITKNYRPVQKLGQREVHLLMAVSGDGEGRKKMKS